MLIIITKILKLCKNFDIINKNSWEKAMVEVVGAFIRDNDRFLICQRPPNKGSALLWEFAGGKVENGESHRDALIRECTEELSIKISVGDIIAETVYTYPDITVHLSVFEAEIIDGTVRMLEHNDIRWIKAEQIDEYDFCPADIPVLKTVKELRMKR